MTNLATFLAERRIAQSDFAKIVNATPSTISRICRGKRFPSRRLASRIVAATEGAVTIEDLLGFGVDQASLSSCGLSSRKSEGFTP
ncbi:helix-turn-helix transcriptional regulator [Roseibium sp. MMSF_3361]|uniref:helix-turn-helix transcriptional regulator n=1 Tax=unclassified Roseibium TaxID=2629323 RepID=UPI003531E690